MAIARSSGAVISSAVLVVTAYTLPGLLVGTLASEILSELNLSHTSLGLAAAVFWLAAAAGSAPAGRFVDRFGAIRGMHLGGALAALGAIGAAFATSPAMLFASLAVGGSANALATPGVSALASSAIPKKRQGLAFGLQLAGPAIAALLAGLALPILARVVGWRPIFVAAAILAIVAAALVPRVTIDHRAGSQRSEDHRLAPLLTFAIGAAAANIAAGALLTFLVLFGIERGLSGAAAGALLAAASGSAVVIRLALGVLADRRPEAALRWVVGLLVVGATGYALLTSANPVFVVVGAIVAIGLAWGWPGLLLFAVVMRHRGDPGAAVGVVVTGFFAGAVVGPIVAGAISERASFEFLWWLCAGLVMFAAGAIYAGNLLLQAGHKVRVNA